MTTHPKNDMKVSKIKSPNPDYNGVQYIQRNVFKMKKLRINRNVKKVGNLTLQIYP